VTEEPPRRIVIENISPSLDCGQHPVKRTLGDRVDVEADVFRDGHEVLGGVLRTQAPGSSRWVESPLVPHPTEPDRWVGSFEATELGRWRFTIAAWVDRIASWRWEIERKVEAGQQDLSSELAEGAHLLGRPSLTVDDGLALTEEDRSEPVELERSFEVDVDRVLARFGAWYELFPRSWGGFRGVEAVLPELAELGFDVVYLPPIHPIGHTNRKGRNNTLTPERGDPGSPWAIGAEEGGHDAINPELGTLADFDSMVARATDVGIDIALDFAIQCSPDHPWLKQHPEWFHHRPDGTLKYAENPPKRYQDIYNVNFACEDWRGLWNALRDVVLHWVLHGVKAFRVDNPHTKPLAFWEWLIREVRAEHPDVIFLAEAFTRPPMMRELAKIGFNQSYTYFTWKNARWELEQYLTELTGEMAEYYRPNFFANTPDILHEYLQQGGPPAFHARLVLAATLSPTYGIYSGFEAFENVAVREGSEEYLDSEKYELKRRALDGELLPLVRTLNELRRTHPSLQRLGQRFFDASNEQLLAYAKQWEEDAMIVCVNLDPAAEQVGSVDVHGDLGLAASFSAVDLLTDTRHDWHVGPNGVQLPPGGAVILHVR
jgi:starch synthase (maltosyl-transferring)